MKEQEVPESLNKITDVVLAYRPKSAGPRKKTARPSLSRSDRAVWKALRKKPMYLEDLTSLRLKVGKRHLGLQSVADCITKLQDLDLIRMKSDGRFLAIVAK
jgi:hypothetical protein